MRKAIKITIVLAILAVPSAALAANTSQPQAINCSQFKTRPMRITLSCGDAGTWLGKLKWSSWTSTKAVATGNFSENTCTPNCAAGHTKSVAMTVTLSKVRNCPGQGKVSPAFKHATIVYKGTRPKGAPLSANFTCPPSLPGEY
jgi:hypothetical protein